MAAPPFRDRFAEEIDAAYDARSFPGAGVSSNVGGGSAGHRDWELVC
jgi:hypothetical protein